MKKSNLMLVKRQIISGRYLCIVLAIIIIVLHALFTMLRTDTNHIWMLLANILTDVLGGWGIIFIAGTYIAPRQRFYAVACRPAEQLSGVVESVSEHTLRQLKIDCYEIKVNGKIVFLPCHFPIVHLGDQVVFSVSNGVVVEVL